MVVFWTVIYNEYLRVQMAPFNLFSCWTPFWAAAPVVAPWIRRPLDGFLTIFTPCPHIWTKSLRCHMLHYPFVLVLPATYRKRLVNKISSAYMNTDICEKQKAKRKAQGRTLLTLHQITDLFLYVVAVSFLLGCFSGSLASFGTEMELTSMVWEEKGFNTGL